MQQPDVSNLPPLFEEEESLESQPVLAPALEQKSLSRLVDPPFWSRRIDFRLPSLNLFQSSSPVQIGAMAVVCVLALLCAFEAKQSVERSVAQNAARADTITANTADAFMNQISNLENENIRLSQANRLLKDKIDKQEAQYELLRQNISGPVVPAKKVSRNSPLSLSDVYADP